MLVGFLCGGPLLGAHVIDTFAETLNAQGRRVHHTTLSGEAAAFIQAAERPEIEELEGQILG